MEKNMKTIAYAVVLAITIIIWGFLLNASGISVAKLSFIGELTGILAIVAQPASIALIIVFPTTFAVAGIVALKSTGKGEAYVPVLAGVIVGLAVALGVFGAGAERILLSVFFILAMILFVESVFWKRGEYKKWVGFRATADASKKALMAVALGVFLVTAFTVLGNEQAYIQDFEDSMLEMSVGEGAQGLAEQSADIALKTQKQAVDSIMALPHYSKLLQKDDLDVKMFTLSMSSLKEQLDSPELRQQAIAEAEENLQSGGIMDFEKLKQVSPMIETIEKYYWVIAAVTLAGMFLFIVNLICAHLAGVYAAIGRIGKSKALAAGKKL